MFDKLIVVHCRLDGEDSVSAELNDIRAIDYCFVPETCARQIYIFLDLSSENEEKLKRSCEHLGTKTKKTEILYAYDAYEFLLRWAVGLESSKLKHNDHFVLGKLRDFWTSYQREQRKKFGDEELKQSSTEEGKDSSERKEREMAFFKSLLVVIPELLKQSSAVRLYIQEKLTSVTSEQRIDATTRYCTYLRTVAEHPQQTMDNPFFPVKPVTVEELTAKSKQISKSLISLQNNIPAQTIKLTPAPDDGPSIAQLKKFSVAIGQIHQKRKLEEEKRKLEEETSQLTLS